MLQIILDNSSEPPTSTWTGELAGTWHTASMPR